MGILTGDLISELPFKTLTQSMIFPYAEPKELKNLDMILKNNYADENVTKLRELMMSNINWDYLIEEYLKFKTENNDLTSLSNFISGSINTFGGKRKKRQIENTISPIILNMTDMESLINTLNTLNLTAIQDVVVTLATEMNEIMKQLQTIADLYSTGQISLDIDTMVTMMMTSPQFSKITRSITTIMNELEPYIKETEYHEMYTSVKEGFSQLNQLLLNSTLRLSDVLVNWKSIVKFIDQNKIFSETETTNIANSLVSPQMIFALFKKLEDFECSKEKVTRYVEFFENNALLNLTVDMMINSTCGFIKSEKLIELLYIIDTNSAMDYLMSVMDLSPTSLAESSNITVIELFETIDSVSSALDILPSVNQSLTELMDQLNITEFNMTTVSSLLCGAELTTTSTNYEVNLFILYL